MSREEGVGIAGAEGHVVPGNGVETRCHICKGSLREASHSAVLFRGIGLVQFCSEECLVKWKLTADKEC